MDKRVRSQYLLRINHIGLTPEEPFVSPTRRQTQLVTAMTSKEIGKWTPNIIEFARTSSYRDNTFMKLFSWCTFHVLELNQGRGC